MKRTNVPNKTIARGKKILSLEEIIELNRRYWEEGLSDKQMLRDFKSSLTVIYRNLTTTHKEYLQMKAQYESGKR